MDIPTLDALRLSAAIAAREVSCVEVMEAALARIADVNPALNALVSLRDPDILMTEARRADAELDRGTLRGWMHGFPHAVKDLANVKGLVTTMGSPVFKDTVAQADDIFVERIRAAGAIFIGKTNTPEFGLGSNTYNPVFGVTRNVLDPTRTAGGSSGGAAVALAAGMVPVADGSDMMGSLRNPAAWNGVIGFRPSMGRIPDGNAADLFAGSLATIGPMGRTVADTAQLFATMAGYDSRAPLSTAGDPAVFAPPLGRDMVGLRIGWLGDLDGYLAMEEGVLALCETALGTLRDLGCTVSEARLDFPPEALWETWLTLRKVIVAELLAPLYTNESTRASMKPEAVWEVENGLRVTAAEIAKARAGRSAWYRALRGLFGRFDLLVLPSAQVFPFDADIHWPKEIVGRTMDTYHRWMEVVIPGTLGGGPVINVPAGVNADGLAMGMQLMGPMNADRLVLDSAYAYGQARIGSEQC